VLIATLLLNVPLWVTVPAYFLIGVLWALLYLPRSISLQAQRYRKWRDHWTGGRPLREVLSGKTDFKGAVSPADFLRRRDFQGKFSERRIITGFVANIAIWPIRIVWIFWSDLLAAFWRMLARWIRAFFEMLGRWLRAFWCEVIVPVFRWVYRQVMRVYRRAMVVYQAIIQRANREAIADMAILAGDSQEKK
jgi:hypothetical protein